LSLFSNNKRFQKYNFKTESELEALISNNSKLLFGDRSVYIDVKKRINSGELGKTIPDGLLFDLSDIENPKFFLVEVELAKHSFFNHIFPQITKFFAFIREGNAFQSDLISYLYKFIESDQKLSSSFKNFIGCQELFKFLKDTVENSTEILILIDELKPEFKEIKDTYTDTWDKYVQILTVNKYYNEKNEIIQIEPDFELIKDELPSIEEISEEEEIPRKYTEEYHLEGVRPDIKKLYYAIRDQFSNFQLNPQKHYISIRSGHNFVFIKMRKSKIKLTVMLPFEVVQKLADKLTIVEPVLSVQRFYYGKCSSFLLNDESELPEALKIIELASKCDRIKVTGEGERIRQVITNTNDCNDFFQSLTVTESIPTDVFRIHTINLSGGLPPIYLNQISQVTVSWEGYAKKLEKFLANQGYLVSEEVTKVITALFVIRNKGMSNLSDSFNEMILNSIDLKANHYFLLPAACPDDFENFELDSFRIGKFDSEKFKYWLKKAECAIPVMVDSMKGAFSISGAALNVKSIKPNLNIRTQFEMNIWQVYFDSTAVLSFNIFWQNLEYLQSIILPLGGVDFPGSSLRAIPRSMSITLFIGVNEASKGFVCLEANLQMFIGLLGLDKHSVAARNRFEELGFELKEDVRLHPSIKLVLDLYQSSTRHLANGHIAEGFLNYIIALEVLFADRSGIGDAIAKRAATLTSKAISSDMKTAIQFFKDIYAERSKFVHSGECGIDTERLQVLKLVVAEAIICAYRATKKSGSFDIENWRSNIDLLNLSLALNRKPDGAIYENCGMLLI